MFVEKKFKRENEIVSNFCLSVSLSFPPSLPLSMIVDQIKSLLRSVGGESYFTLARRQEATVKLPRSEGQPQLSNSWLRKTFSL